MKLSKLTSKDVINDVDGNKLGKIHDAEIDTLTGKITSIKIKDGLRIAGFLSSKSGYTIPWNKILKIGKDVIIVDLNESDQNVKKENK